VNVNLKSFKLVFFSLVGNYKIEGVSLNAYHENGFISALARSNTFVSVNVIDNECLLVSESKLVSFIDPSLDNYSNLQDINGVFSCSFEEENFNDELTCSFEKES